MDRQSINAGRLTAPDGTCKRPVPPAPGTPLPAQGTRPGGPWPAGPRPLDSNPAQRDEPFRPAAPPGSGWFPNTFSNSERMRARRRSISWSMTFWVSSEERIR